MYFSLSPTVALTVTVTMALNISDLWDKWDDEWDDEDAPEEAPELIPLIPVLPLKCEYYVGKNGTQVLVDPYNCIMHKKRKNEKLQTSTYWCSKRATHDCLVKINCKNEYIIQIEGQHTHDSDILKSNVESLVNDTIAKCVANPTIVPRTAMLEMSKIVSEDPQYESGLGNLPKARTFARNLQRKRKRVDESGPIPKRMKDLVMPEQFKQTTDGHDFVIIEQNVIEGDDTKKVWGWCTKAAINVLQHSDEVYGDGTFEIVKHTLFEQAWILVGKSERLMVTIPCAYFLLPDKTYETYKLIMQSLKYHGFEPKTFHLDFEAAAIKACKDVWPNCKIVCCDTHWKRALRTNQNKIGLVPYIHRYREIETFIRKMWALSYVPKDKIVSVWDDYICPSIPLYDNDNEDGADDYNTTLENLVRYCERTWIGPMSIKNKTRGQPKFKYDLWNKYDEVKFGSTDLTSNHSEAYNCAQKLSLPTKPDLWKVCQALKDEETFTQAKIARGINGDPQNDPNPGRTNKRLSTAAHLKHIVDKWDIFEDKNDYINALVLHFNDDGV